MSDRCSIHKELTEKINATYEQKNTAYGNSFDRSIDRFGYIAGLVRMEDKMNRLEQLLIKNAEPNDESAVDTALDLANYAIMIAMYIISKSKEQQIESPAESMQRYSI